MGKKKALIFGAIGAGLAIILALVFLVILPLQNTLVSKTPTGLHVIEFQDGSKKIYVDRHTEARSYLFTIQKTGSQTTENKRWFSNEFEAKLLLNEPSAYTISCQYIGSNPNNKSQVATITFKPTFLLEAPAITLGTGADQNKLFIENSKHFAETINLHYTLIYTHSGTPATSTNFVWTHTDNHGLVHGYFDLASIATPGQTYSFAVQVSVLNSEFYAPGTSEQKTITIA